jgi:hypothetical protein
MGRNHAGQQKLENKKTTEIKPQYDPNWESLGFNKLHES